MGGNPGNGEFDNFDWSPLTLQKIKLKPKFSINTLLARLGVLGAQQCSVFTQGGACCCIASVAVFSVLWLHHGLRSSAMVSLLWWLQRRGCQPASSHGGCSVPAACSSSSRLKHRSRSLSCGVCGQLCVEPAGSTPSSKNPETTC